MFAREHKQARHSCLQESTIKQAKQQLKQGFKHDPGYILHPFDASFGAVDLGTIQLKLGIFSTNFKN